MKTTKLMIVLWMSVMVFSSIDLMAQKGNRPMNKQQNLKERKVEIDAKKQAFVIEYLALNATEAENYKKIIADADAKEKDLRTGFRKEMADYRNKKWNELTEKEAEEMLAKQETHFQIMSKHRQETISQLKKVMPVAKVAKIKEAELEFRRTIVKEARHNRQNRPGMKEAPCEE